MYAQMQRQQRAQREPLRLLREVERGRYDVLGSQGNVYQVRVAQRLECTCPDHKRNGNRCKHIYFILHLYLRLPLESAFASQETFSARDLEQVFSVLTEHQRARAERELRASAGVMAQYASKVLLRATAGGASAQEEKEEERKAQPAVARRALDADDCCSICLLEMAADDAQQPLLWCTQKCGQNFHRECLVHWARAMAQSAPAASLGAVEARALKCPLCREPWNEHDLPEFASRKRKKPSSSASASASGAASEYVNLLSAPQ